LGTDRPERRVRQKLAKVTARFAVDIGLSKDPAFARGTKTAPATQIIQNSFVINFSRLNRMPI
jgi:hypothetical protein